MTPEQRAAHLIRQANNADGDQVGHIIDHYQPNPERFHRALTAADTHDATIALTSLANARQIDVADNTFRSALSDVIVGETCRRWIRAGDYEALTGVWYDAHGSLDNGTES